MSAISWIPAISATVLAVFFGSVLASEEPSKPGATQAAVKVDAPQAAKSTTQVESKTTDSGKPAVANTTVNSKLVTQVESELKALVGRAKAAKNNPTAMKQIQDEKYTAWKKLNSLPKEQKDGAYKLMKEIEGLAQQNSAAASEVTRLRKKLESANLVARDIQKSNVSDSVKQEKMLILLKAQKGDLIRLKQIDKDPKNQEEYNKALKMIDILAPP